MQLLIPSHHPIQLSQSQSQSHTPHQCESSSSASASASGSGSSPMNDIDDSDSNLNQLHLIHDRDIVLVQPAELDSITTSIVMSPSDSTPAHVHAHTITPQSAQPAQPAQYEQKMREVKVMEEDSPYAYTHMREEYEPPHKHKHMCSPTRSQSVLYRNKKQKTSRE